jgi:hypothetical protein
VKTAIGSLTLALALLVTPAAATAAEGPRLVPPKEFDRPFAAKVIVVTARDQNHVRELCPKAKFIAGFPALACSYLTSAWDCKIVVAADDVIKAVGFPPELVKRHEIAHCNGWPADHGGALPYEEWAINDTPVKAAASQFPKFALSAFGKTVAEVAKGLPYGRLFFVAAAELGLAPESHITGQLLSNPVTARALAVSAGIGYGLSDEEWREAHAIAFYASKARQAENAAAANQSVPNLGQAAPQPQQAQPPPSGAAPR